MMDNKGKTRRSARLYKRNREQNREKESTQTEETNNDDQSDIVIDRSLLTGLSVKNGEYIKIDENLLKRLKPVEPEPIIINPFKDSPEFTSILKDGTSLSIDTLDRYSRNHHDDPMAVKMADILGNLPIELVAMKYSKMISENWDYNVKISVTPKVSNQEGVGLCWMHAATNVLRHDIMKKFQVDSKFEISQTYLYFYDKVERCNLFIEYLWALRHKGLRDFQVNIMASPQSSALLLSDGGMYPFFSNLAKKYGIVPSNIYGRSINCRSSETMNDILIKILNRMILPFFREGIQWTRDEFEEYKDECNQTIYDVLVRFLGEPLRPTDTFDWTYKDVHGESHTIRNMTPEKFYRIVSPSDDTKVVIIHDPRHPETCFQPSWVEYGLNMHGEYPSSLINLPLDVFKRVIYESLKNDDAVWFASDVHQGFDPDNKTWDTERFDYENVLGTPLEFDKADMLETLVGVSCHAMAFNGVDTEEDLQGNVVKYNKWRVFNSWGSAESEEKEEDYGFYRMTDEYFDRYVTAAVIDLKYFEPEDTRKILTNAKSGNTFTYKFTDAFGAVALGGCSCKKK